MALKFRAWLFDEKKMVPVWQMWFDQKYGETRAMVKSPKTGKFIINPFPIMQFIGKTDKNGKDIYDCDIMEFDFPDIGKQKAIVYFNEKYASFCLKPLGNFQYCNFEDGIVLGNIYENIELFEKAKKFTKERKEDK